MAYHYPQQGAPGSTAYYTLPNVGGFYAPVSTLEHGRRRGDNSSSSSSGIGMNMDWSGMLPQQQPPFLPPQPYAQQPYAQQPYVMGMGGGQVQGGMPDSRVYNGWQGVKEKTDKGGKNKGGKDKGDKADKLDHKKKDQKPQKYDTADLSPWQQLTASLKKKRQSRRHPSSDSGSGSISNSRNKSNNTSNSNSDDDHGKPSQVTCLDSAMVEVVIQPYGSARINVHIDDGSEDGGDNDDNDNDNDDANEKIVSFVVSDRCLRTTAKEWPAQCHAGTHTCDIHVGCDEAVIGMYWMLHVLHQATPMTTSTTTSTSQAGLLAQQRDRQFQQQVALQQFLQQRRTSSSSGGGGSGSGSGSGTSTPRTRTETTHFVYDYYHGCVGSRAVPIELPPRVLAYTVMLAVQFGVLTAWQAGSGGGVGGGGGGGDPALLGGGAAVGNLASTAPPAAPTAPPPAMSPFRAAADEWLRAITANRCNATTGRLNHVTVRSDDLLYVLYAARTLGGAALVRLCQLTILDRWSVDESADWFRDAYGRAVRVDRLLPAQMVETVSMDLFCLKTARDRSLGKVADLATRLHASIR